MLAERTCPLGPDCDLTVAWMAGQHEARDSYRQRIEELRTQLGLARLDADQQRQRADIAEAEALDWRAQVGALSDEVKRLRAELAAAREGRDYGC
jgi:uncharacterized coiled-coil DUF342 family protein